jgi:predicted Zn-dependent protease
MAQPATGRGGSARPVLQRRPALLWAAVGLAAAGAVVALVLQRHRDRVEGIRLALDGKLDAAEPLLAAALDRDPADADAWRALALGRMAAGKFAEAEGPIDQWRALWPSDSEPHLARIDWAMRMNRLPEAIESAGAALELQPGTADLRERRAGWLFLVGRSEEAAAECRRCREARPDDPDLIRLEAEICYRLGDNGRAGALVDDLLRRDPQDPTALTLRGALDLDADRPDRAVGPLREAVARLGPAAGRARYYLGLALARTGQEAEARKHQAVGQVQQAVELWEKYGRPDTASYKVTIAESLLAAGRADEAVRLLERAVAQDPGCVAAHRLLADYYASRGQVDKAAGHRRKAGD